MQVVLVVKNLPANARDIRDTISIPGLGRSPGGGHGKPLQYSCLESTMDRGAGHDLVTEKQRLNGGKFQNQERVLFYPVIQSNIRGKTKIPYNKINKIICPQMYLSMTSQ